MSGWFKEILISEVQCRPVLWQDSNKNFKNKSVTDGLWRDVGLVCGVNGGIAKAKWKNLKDQFRKEYRKSSEIKPGAKTSKWKYLNSLLFLKEFVGPSSNNQGYVDVNTTTVDDTNESRLSYDQELDPLQLNIVKNETLDEYYDDDAVDIETDDRDIKNKLEVFSSQLNCPPTQDYESSLDMGLSNKRKRKISNCDEAYTEQQSDKEMTINASTEAADMQFFKSLLPYMERLPLIERLELRTNIQQMVLDKYRAIVTQE